MVNAAKTITSENGKIVMEGKRKKTKKNTLQPASKYFAYVDKDELVPNRTLFKDSSSQ